LRVALNRAYRVEETRSLHHPAAEPVLHRHRHLRHHGDLLPARPRPARLRLAQQWMPGIERCPSPSASGASPIALVVLVAGLFVAHKWLPNGKRSFASLVPGIALTLVAWMLGAILFASYLESFAAYVTTYAGLASIMIALVFLYIIAAIFILGAEVNAAIIRLPRSAGLRRQDPGFRGGRG
jgi:membrane protein